MTAFSKTCRGLLCGAALLALSAPSLAQNTSATDNMVVEDGFNANDDATVDRTVTTTRTEDDDDFPWGLLGLLGLAGLMGRKRRDAPDINVDARRDTRP